MNPDAMRAAGIRPPLRTEVLPGDHFAPIKPTPGWLAMLRRAFWGPTVTVEEMMPTCLRGDGTAAREYE